MATLSVKQQLAARYIAGGMTMAETRKLVGVAPTVLRKWVTLMAFKRYLRLITRQYFTALDSELITLKTAAFRVLRDAMEQEDNVPHREWAVERVFQIERARASVATAQEKAAMTKDVPAVNVNVLQGDAFKTPEQKQAAKVLLAGYRDERPGLAMHGGEA